MPRLLSVLALLAGTAAAAQPPIPRAVGDGPFSPPKRLEPRNGAAVYVPPATVVDAKYIPLDGEGPFDVTAIGGTKTAFVFLTRGLPAGKVYRFVGVGSNEKGDLTLTEFEVPIPGTPTPPTPPTPPGPAFPPEMRAKLQAAYAQDDEPEAEKADLRRQLWILYETCVSAKIAFDPDVTTGVQLIARMKGAGQTMTPDKLVATRIAIAELVQQKVSREDTLTDAVRQNVHVRFGEIAAALKW